MTKLLESLTCGLAILLHITFTQAQNSNSTNWPWQTFKSSSAQPPQLQVTKTGPTSPGYLFFDQNGDYAHNYSLFIMDDNNELIWQSARGDYSAFQPQVLDGQNVLTYFNGISFPEPWGFGYGIIEILNESYENIYNISLTAANEGYQGIMNSSDVWSYIDMHESKITTDNTILVTVINVTQFDLSAIGGPSDGWIADSLFYEIDVHTNEVLFRWSSLDYIDQVPLENVIQLYPLEDLGRNQTYPWGYFHINSVDKFEDGSYLISSRTYCSIFKISPNGSVEWALQGRDGGDFSLGAGISFCYQHDARIRQEFGSLLTISFFNNDNNAEHVGVNQTTGIILTLDAEAMTATLRESFVDSLDPIFARSQGNLQLLSDTGHAVMGYGAAPTMKEYSSNGTCVMTAKFGQGQGNIMSYRAYRSPWTGRPKSPPDVIACNDHNNNTAIYMSWMGATDNMQWKVYGGTTSTNLEFLDEKPRDGFETKAVMSGTMSFVRVEAIDTQGVKANSSVVQVLHKC